ncbi:MAG: N-acetylmuramoyl-L-alanine amidase [Janthinobacterium lividum]
MSQYITRFKSPNYNERAAGTNIEFLIIHYTGCDFISSLRALTNKESSHPVSAHYLIDQEGDVYILVDENFEPGMLALVGGMI